MVRTPRALRRAALLGLLPLLSLLVTTAPADAAPTTTYSATRTIPAPPASSYAGSGGGDGWALAFSATQVFNVFHHNTSTTVACHLQSNATPCWEPRTVTDANGSHFSTSGHPGLHLDADANRLYVFGTRNIDSTAGVVCIDTAAASSSTNPFCGFTALTPLGEGPPTLYGTSGTSMPMRVGNRWFAFNYVNGPVDGARNKVLCFDLGTKAACAGQPFSVALAAGGVDAGGYPESGTAVIGDRLILPVYHSDGSYSLSCFDATTSAGCTGSWPLTLSFVYAQSYGAPFPKLDTNGAITGFCLPTGVDQCFTFTGASTPTPPNMTSVITGSTPWNGPAVTLGARVYVPNGSVDAVQCYDYSSAAGCANFPHSLPNDDYTYTVNADPQRPACLWTNADRGSAQIQNFDAYTGGACGSGPVRVLASQFVVPQEKCEPTAYQALQIVEPARSTYSDGSVAFRDGNANPIAGASDRALDQTGTADLTGLDLDTPSGLPQFLITLVNAGSPGQLRVRLTWTGTYDQDCVGSGTTVTPPPSTTAPSIDRVAGGFETTGASATSASGVRTSGPNELLLALVQADGPPGATQRVTAVTGAGLTWTRAAYADIAGAGAAEIWQAFAPSALPSSGVRATFARPANGSITVVSFIGASPTLGAVGLGSAPGGPVKAKVTPARSSSLLVASGLDWSTATKPTPVAGQALLTYFKDTVANAFYFTQYVPAPTTAGSAVTVQSALPVGDRWSLVAVEVQPS